MRHLSRTSSGKHIVLLTKSELALLNRRGGNRRRKMRFKLRASAENVGRVAWFQIERRWVSSPSFRECEPEGGEPWVYMPGSAVASAMGRDHRFTTQNKKWTSAAKTILDRVKWYRIGNPPGERIGWWEFRIVLEPSGKPNLP